MAGAAGGLIADEACRNRDVGELHRDSLVSEQWGNQTSEPPPSAKPQAAAGYVVRSPTNESHCRRSVALACCDLASAASCRSGVQFELQIVDVIFHGNTVRRR